MSNSKSPVKLKSCNCRNKTTKEATCVRPSKCVANKSSTSAPEVSEYTEISPNEPYSIVVRRNGPNPDPQTSQIRPQDLSLPVSEEDIHPRWCAPLGPAPKKPPRTFVSSPSPSRNYTPVPSPRTSPGEKYTPVPAPRSSPKDKYTPVPAPRRSPIDSNKTEAPASKSSSEELECTLTGCTKPSHNHKPAAPPVVTHERAALPVVTPRRHDPTCVIEVSVLEKHVEGCLNKKVDKGGRNRLEDKVGSYDVVNRYVYDSCNNKDGEGDIKNSVKSFRLNDPNSFGAPAAANRTKVDLTPVLPSTSSTPKHITIEHSSIESISWQSAEIEEPQAPSSFEISSCDLDTFHNSSELLEWLRDRQGVEEPEIIPAKASKVEKPGGTVSVDKAYSVGDSRTDDDAEDCGCVIRYTSSMQQIMNEAKEEMIAAFQHSINQILSARISGAVPQHPGDKEHRGTMVNLQLVVPQSNKSTEVRILQMDSDDLANQRRKRSAGCCSCCRRKKSQALERYTYRE